MVDVPVDIISDDRDNCTNHLLLILSKRRNLNSSKENKSEQLEKES